MLTRLYRVILRQRLVFTPGADISVPEKDKPGEVEGRSVERDITSYVRNYKISGSKEALSGEASFTFLNAGGELTPENHKSPWNISPLDGTTYAPLLAEGNEIQIFRITSAKYLDPSYRNDKTKWVPRFRGTVRTVTFGTDSGQDTLQVTAGDVLSRAVKRNFTGTFSPISRSSSILPANHFFDLSTMQSAVTLFRTVNSDSNVLNEAPAFICPPTKPEPNMMPAGELAHLIYWDRDDHYHSLGKDISRMPRFGKENYKERSTNYIPVNSTTTLAVYNLNGYAWYLAAGVVSKDVTRKHRDPDGSLKMINGTLKVHTQKVPVGVPHVLRLSYLIEDSSNIRVIIKRRKFDRSTLTFVDGADTTIVDTGSIVGPTSFRAEELGGLLLNPPVGQSFEWRSADIHLPEIASSWGSAENGNTRIHYEVKVVATGTVWIDAPRWEFTHIDVAPDKKEDNLTENPAAKTAIVLDNNLLSLPAFERWVTKDGIVYTDPFPEHRSLVAKNVRVVLRNLRAPYVAGTEAGYGPIHLRKRSLPESYLYERELVEGTDYEVLQDKGCIQLATAYTRCEVFVSHGYYDLDASSHMEASNMIRHLLVKGCGIPTDAIHLEPTGIILSKISLGVSTTQNIMSAIQDITKQLPQNYYLQADGDGNVIGRFIQQEGSPRLFNPIIQAPIAPLNTEILQKGSEYWYGVTALMPDGKETLVSNLMSTVQYNNYFDAGHQSLVDGMSCPALMIKPVPNMVGLVIRRAKTYKSAEEEVVVPAKAPAYRWDFNDLATPLVAKVGDATLADPAYNFATHAAYVLH